MQKSLHEHTILFQQVMKIQSSAFNISEEDILKMRRDGEDFNVKLTAYEAMEKGIIHEIVEKPLFSF
ncbi:MAG: hypothetical protein IT215_04440 [Chitinophagaceae bacterium]|nr:hypothetical protein [Chitinophagaceae bacterium]